MAGARPSGFKQSGGFLNNVDGAIVDYDFTTVFPGKDGKPAKKAKGQPDFGEKVYMVLSVQQDGSEELKTTTLSAGSAEFFEISEDGKTLTAPDGGPVSMSASCAVAKFIGSLIDAGFPETSLSDDEDSINFEPIIGTRVRFLQVVNEQTTKEYGKKVDKKTGKSYDRKNLTVSDVLSLPGEQQTSKTTKGVKAAPTGKGKPVTAAKGKANGAVKVDLEELAAETLLAILADNDGTIDKSKLPAKIAMKLGAKHPHKDDVRKLIYSDAFLETENGWSYDGSSKAQTISLS